VRTRLSQRALVAVGGITEDEHSGGYRRRDPGRRVLHYGATGWLDCHGSGGVEEQVRVWLASRDRVGREQRVGAEEVPQAGEAEGEPSLLELALRGHADRDPGAADALHRLGCTADGREFSMERLAAFALVSLKPVIAQLAAELGLCA
jgi:hypothetical protein